MEEMKVIRQQTQNLPPFSHFSQFYQLKNYSMLTPQINIGPLLPTHSLVQSCTHQPFVDFEKAQNQTERNPSRKRSKFRSSINQFNTRNPSHKINFQHCSPHMIQSIIVHEVLGCISSPGCRLYLVHFNGGHQAYIGEKQMRQSFPIKLDEYHRVALSKFVGQR